MSIKIGNNILAKSNTYHPDLFDVKWSDHIINNISWLRADTFSWHSGELYSRAYEHLLEDWNNSELSEEVIPGLASFKVRVAPDGHKMVSTTNDGPERVQEVFETTGIAWYYIIDTENKRFKLPRTKFGFTGIRSGVGGFVEAGLPDIKGQRVMRDGSGVVSGDNAYFTDNSAPNQQGYFGKNGNVWTTFTLNFQASHFNSIYGNSDTVQPKTTEMYLYFYVGNYAQSDLENVVGEMSEVLNNKADIDLLNILSNIDFVVESQFPTSENNYTWYRKYKSGWIEQGGSSSGGTSVTVTLPVAMVDSNYTIVLGNTSGGYEQIQITNKTATTFSYCNAKGSTAASCYWRVSGMVAQ
jgi:hypothetical protein